MHPIPLARMRYAASFAQIRQSIDAPRERLLSSLNLSEEMLSARDDFVTVSQLWPLTAFAADYTGNFNFGFEAGLTPLEDITVIDGKSKWLDAEPRGVEVEPIHLIMKDDKIYKNTL